MLNTKVNFERICGLVTRWSWNELKVGIEKSLISNKDIISYAILILSEELEQFELVLALSIAEDDEVGEILFKLALNEDRQRVESMEFKWMFAIIYDAYVHLKNEVYNVIEDVYAEFGYPKEISKLVGYMPNDDNRPMEVKLDEYIENCRKIWC